MEKVVSEAEELPKAIVRRVVKDKLSQCSSDSDINVHKDAILAFSESARIFIHYLSATANDICKESKRQTINGDDVLKALEEIEFPELLKPLKASLAEFRKKNTGKKAAASKGKEVKGKEVKGKEVKGKEVKKKRKLEEESSHETEASDSKQDEKDEDEEEAKDEDNEDDEEGSGDE